MGMTVGIVCMGLANGREVLTSGQPSPLGQWLKSYDPEAHRGRGAAEWTDLPADAMQFPGPAEAFRYWKQTSRTRPVRPDGQPNRPLTAFTIMLEPLP